MEEKKLRIYFSGIAGSGVSAIAAFVADRGNTVAGSDRAFDLDPNHPLKRTFLARNITLFPQDGSGLDSTYDFAVFSTAVEPDNPELIKAGERGIPVKTRPDYLSEITGAYRTIAVSGTSGKSSVSGMLAFLMDRLGLDPNFIGGGRVKQFKTASTPGNSRSGSSEYLIIEACESDGSIVNYQPEHTIVLNLALDHHAVSVTSKMFETLAGNTRGLVFVNADDSNLDNLSKGKTRTFSIHNPSDYQATDIAPGRLKTDFTLDGTRFTVSLPGMHNLYNALACISLLSELGIRPEKIARFLPQFEGIDRRFDIHLQSDTVFVVDDYAHNPHKISCLMKTMQQFSSSVCYIFQPHGFGPTRLMKDQYIQVFTGNLREKDHLAVLPIYYVGGTAAKDISSNDLVAEINRAGRSAEVIEDRKEVLRKVGQYEAYVVFGARDETLSDLAGEIAKTASLPGPA